mgnify:CR=1 FL=1
MGALGAGATALGVAPAVSTAAPAAPSPTSAAQDPLDPRQLIAPLAAGSTLARWQILDVRPSEDGALILIAREESGKTFQLDVCLADRSLGAPRAPGQSEHFDVFVSNLGDGATPTREEQGLCAMALADVIRANEAHLSREGYATLRERLDSQRVRRHVD